VTVLLSNVEGSFIEGESIIFNGPPFLYCDAWIVSHVYDRSRIGIYDPTHAHPLPRGCDRVRGMCSGTKALVREVCP
jgi:hypothetical protein